MTRTDKAMGRNVGGNGVKRWYDDEQAYDDGTYNHRCQGMKRWQADKQLQDDVTCNDGDNAIERWYDDAQFKTMFLIT